MKAPLINLVDFDVLCDLPLFFYFLFFGGGFLNLIFLTGSFQSLFFFDRLFTKSTFSFYPPQVAQPWAATLSQKD